LTCPPSTQFALNIPCPALRRQIALAAFRKLGIRGLAGAADQRAGLPVTNCPFEQARRAPWKRVSWKLGWCAEVNGLVEWASEAMS
jgi:hypothetical protein